MAGFVDRVVLHVAAGNGGHGVASVHREKFKPLGGPDGGNGGRGGDVVLVVDENVHTLLDFHHHPHQHAGNGKQGAGSNRNGGDGADLELRVPDGTVVVAPDGEVLADLIGVGTRFIAAHGGRGGLGNAALASTRRKAPGFALLGEPGELRDVVLELKSVADVGLVGFPSAGKSSLIAAMSAARPKIADYPFTTLVPNLGVVDAGGTTFTVADVPGLIPGAAQGKGLGLDFLRHVERCAVLLHVLDCATLDPGRDPISDLDALEGELGQYEGTFGELLGKPRLVALNKVDVPEARELAELVRPELEARGHARLRDLGRVARGPARADLRARRGGQADRAVASGARVGTHRAAARARSTTPASRSSRSTTASSCAARSRSAGCSRPTSPTTRRSATWPTGSPGSASSGAGQARRRARRRGHHRRGHVRLRAERRRRGDRVPADPARLRRPARRRHPPARRRAAGGQEGPRARHDDDD